MDYVDCIVQLTGQLFANTQIPCSLWFLSKNRQGGNGYRRRTGEVLFIDGRKLRTLIPGSRKQKQLSSEEVARIASVYREFKKTAAPAEVRGFFKVATTNDIRASNYALTGGRYVGSAEADDDGMPIEQRLSQLVGNLRAWLRENAELQQRVERVLVNLENAE